MKIQINGVIIEPSHAKTILENCEDMGNTIPSLCYHKDLGSQNVCGICAVEINGQLVKSCNTYPTNGMIIETASNLVVENRKKILTELMKNHPNDCLTCEKAKGDCQLQDACHQYGIENRNTEVTRLYDVDYSSSGMIRDMNKCILCEKCVAVCRDTQGIDVYSVVESQGKKEIVLREGKDLSDTKCINCGQCIKVCPVGALSEDNSVRDLNLILKMREKHLIVQMAPAIKHTIGEEFFLPPGSDATSKMVDALKTLGFDRVFSTDFSADVTIMEEGTELIGRLLNENINTPMFTSCCPGWVNHLEQNYPQYIDNLSSCKSPQQIFGALAKSYYANSENLSPEDIFVVSIMPCTAKKGEANRKEMKLEEQRDVDMVITTREFAKLIRMNNIDFSTLRNDLDYDSFMGKGSSAARIFGTSGGVMEAALRTVSHVLSNGEIQRLDFKEIRGFKNVKETSIQLGERNLKLAVINGISSANSVLKAIENKEVHYDFIEVMACHGGCISGGGAPIPDDFSVREKRMEGMYRFDDSNTLRKSHENPEIKALYNNYLKDPCGHKSHHLLHTTYKDRS